MTALGQVLLVFRFAILAAWDHRHAARALRNARLWLDRTP